MKKACIAKISIDLIVISERCLDLLIERFYKYYACLVRSKYVEVRISLGCFKLSKLLTPCYL